MAVLAELERQLRAAREKRTRLTKEIERLKKEKKIIAGVKDSVSQLKKDAGKKNAHDKLNLKWKGKHDEQYIDLLESNIKSGMNVFYTDVDSVLDAICDAITARQNEIYKQGLLIGRLASQINSINNEIEKAVN